MMIIKTLRNYVHIFRLYASRFAKYLIYAELFSKDLKKCKEKNEELYTAVAIVRHGVRAGLLAGLYGVALTEGLPWEIYLVVGYCLGDLLYLDSTMLPYLKEGKWPNVSEQRATGVVELVYKLYNRFRSKGLGKGEQKGKQKIGRC